VIEPRAILIWLLPSAAFVGYALVRPGVWPWLLIVAAIAGLIYLAYRRTPKIEINRSLSSQRTFQGSSVRVTLEVSVHCVFPTLLSLNESVPLTLIPDQAVGLTGLFWRSSLHTLEYTVRPNSRGGFRWPDLDLSWSDPLGLFQRNASILNADSEMQLLVYPGLHALELPDLLRPVLSDGPPTRVRGLEDASTFAGTRAYAPGDPMRRIHWRQTAKMGMRDGRFNQLIVRELERIAATGVHVHLNQSGDGSIAELYLESATRLAASLLHGAFEAGLRVGLSSSAGETEAGASFAALERALTHLALVRVASEVQTEIPLLEIPLLEIPLPPAGTNLILLTMTAPTDLIDAAIRARSRAAHVLVIALPEGFYLEPGETGRPIKRALPESVRELGARAGILEEAGVRVLILRGDSSVLMLQ
jgi:uncharacterized protein (DUF58 family)